MGLPIFWCPWLVASSLYFPPCPPPHPIWFVPVCVCLHRPFSPKDQSRWIRAHSYLEIFVTTPYPEYIYFFQVSEVGIEAQISWMTNLNSDVSALSVHCGSHNGLWTAPSISQAISPMCFYYNTTLNKRNLKKGRLVSAHRGCLSSCQRSHGDKSWQQLVLLCLESESREIVMDDGAHHTLPFSSVLDLHPWNGAIFTVGLSTSIYAQNALTHMPRSLSPLGF